MAIILILIIEREKVFVLIEPRRFIRRCPAIMFALSRIARVKGRIKFLINSIIIMKLIKGVGVPVGIM